MQLDTLWSNVTRYSPLAGRLEPVAPELRAATRAPEESTAANSLVAGAPCSPCAPVAAVGPVAPSSPAGPVGPWGPGRPGFRQAARAADSAFFAESPAFFADFFTATRQAFE